MKQGMGWPIGVAVVLGATVIGNLIMMKVANGDPSMAIEPNYYAKAVTFDSTIAEERRSVALGWTATSSIATTDSTGTRTVTVTIADAQQQPVRGARVSVTALFNARANDVLSATLTEDAPGQYVAPLAAKYPGQWEVRVDAVRGGEHFVASTRTEVASAVPHGAAQP
jgi:nitrogen fixation protein FixH